MANIYSVRSVFFPGLETNERLSYQHRDLIVIGGDRGDVQATHAMNETDDGEDGVMLYDVDFVTTLDLTASPFDGGIEDEIREVVRACYESIQAETFTQKKHFSS